MNPNNNQAAWKGIYDTLGNISKSLGELNTGGATPAKSTGSGGTKNTNQGLLDALTERLTSQGKGIVSSSTSGLQDALSGAISDTEKSGELTKQALQSEREREVSYSQDRAAAQYTNALESRSGFATMTYGLRELTETTEKSIRDLDKRYQEAILTNDAATAQRVSDLRVKQLEMQQEAEARYMDNLFKAASMQQNEYQFNASYDQADRQFADRFGLDKLAAERGYEIDKLRLAQDKDLAEDELAFKYASMAQDRELTMAQINATLGKKATGNATEVTSYILDVLRTKQTEGRNTGDRAQMAAETRALLDASGLTEGMEPSDYDVYISAAYDLFNKENEAHKTLGTQPTSGGGFFRGAGATARSVTDFASSLKFYNPEGFYNTTKPAIDQFKSGYNR